jgi:hypothetical protein
MPQLPSPDRVGMCIDGLLDQMTDLSSCLDDLEVELQMYIANEQTTPELEGFRTEVTTLVARMRQCRLWSVVSAHDAWDAHGKQKAKR